MQATDYMVWIFIQANTTTSESDENAKSVRNMEKQKNIKNKNINAYLKINNHDDVHCRLNFHSLKRL